MISSSASGIHKNEPPRRAFSLIELIVVLAVTILLTGLMLPAMSKLRESANRIICSSNERQLGHALFMWAHDNNDELPHSEVLDGPSKKPQELMRAYNPETQEWDGWGRLYEYKYCSAVECFYCPSHLGEHPIERYYEDWIYPSGNPIYTNYHYAGDIDWETSRKRRLHRGSEQVLATDGLRTASDINHQSGMNVLSGDGAVRWYEDVEEIFMLLPEGQITSSEQAAVYKTLWSLIEPHR